DRRARGRDRRGVRRAGRIELRPGLSLPAVPRAAADAARLRDRSHPVPVRGCLVRPAHAGRAGYRALGLPTERRTTGMKRCLPLIAVASLLLAACGSKHETITTPAGSSQSVTLMLDWFPNADHVGI